MQAQGKEVNIMQKISEKMMTDEETDSEDEHSVLMKRHLPWRNKMLNKLIKTLDSRRNEESDSAPKKQRKIGPPSERRPPKDAPKWVLQDSLPCSDGSSSPVPPSNVNSPGQSPLRSPLSLSSMPIQTQTPPNQQISRLPPQYIRTPSTPLSHHYTVQTNESSFSEEAESSDDETSCWIRAITGLK